MNFEEWIKGCWRDHARDAGAVADRLSQGLALLESTDHVAPFCQIAIHIFGEHLGQTKAGIDLINKLECDSRVQSSPEAKTEILRAVVTFELIDGDERRLALLSSIDQVRAISAAAAAVCEQKNSKRALVLLRSAVVLAESIESSADLAFRALAVAGNNLAATLEERTQRTEEENALMLEAAKIARLFWEKAGTWLQVERAEYRLASSLLKAGLASESVLHSEKCIEICRSNSAQPLEFFFGFESLAKAKLAVGDREGFQSALKQCQIQFSQLEPGDQAWCKASLDLLGIA